MKEVEAPLLATGVPASPNRGWACRWEVCKEELRHRNLKSLLTLSIVFGIICGFISLVYSFCLETFLSFTWETIPEHVVLPLLKKIKETYPSFPGADKVAWVYIMVVAITYGGLNGVARRVVGYPGDMENTIERVHSHGFLPLKQAPAMFFSSMFSVTAGSSLGPEAPLLAICATVVSCMSKKLLGHNGRMLRSCALMAMAAGLAAFFGVSFGGAVFAFEVLHTNGLQHFDTITYAVLSSVLCLAVYRGLWLLKPFGAVWAFEEVLETADTRHILVGVFLGCVGVLLTYVYTIVHLTVKKVWHSMGFVESKRPIFTGMFAGLTFGLIGVFLPPTMFWGEFEMKTVADDSVELEHVWPKGGFYGLEPFWEGNYTPAIWFAIGFLKMITIAITGVSGLRGGFIFPLMLSGACIGRGLSAFEGIPWWSNVPSSLPAIALAGALTTGITRTPFACALILTALAGVPSATAPTLVACLIVFYATMSRPFIKAQKDRDDVAFLDIYLPDDDEEVVGAAAQQAHVDAEKGKPTMPADDYEGEPESSGAGSSGEGPENEVDEKEVAKQTPDDTQAAVYGGGTAENVFSSAGGGGGGGGGGDHTSTYA